MAGDVARCGELALIGGGSGLHSEHVGFASRLALKPFDLLSHCRSVIFQKSDLVEIKVEIRGIKFLGDGFVGGGPGLQGLIQMDIAENEIVVVEAFGGSEAAGLAKFVQRAFIVAKGLVNNAEILNWDGFAGIDL